MAEFGPGGGTGLPHLRQIDGLRAVAVAAVVAYHLDSSWLPGGFLGVDLFMVISGFLITRLLLSEANGSGSIDLARFWQRRVKRLMPASVALIVVVVIVSALVVSADQLESLRKDAAASLLYVANWRFILDEQSYFDLFSDVSPLRHLWSLAIEEQFYLVFPLVVFALRRRRIVLVGVIIVGIVTSAIWMSVLSADPSRAYYGTDTRAQTLLAGALLAWLAVRAPGVLEGRGVSIAGVTGAGIVAVMLVVVDDRDEWMYHGGFLLFAVATTALLASVVESAPTTRINRTLSLAPIVALGAASYSVYLWHWPIIVLMTSRRTGLEGYSLALAQLGFIAVASTASYQAIERTVRRADVRPRRVVWASGTALAVSLGVVVGATAGATAPPAYFAADGSARSVQGGDNDASGSPRPLLVGDSVAASLSDAMSSEAVAQNQFMASAPVSGCGLLPGLTLGDDLTVYEPSRECPAMVDDSLAAALDSVRPTVVIWLSAWDAENREVRGRVIQVGTPDGDRVMEELIDARVRSFEERNIDTILVTLPRVGGDGNASLGAKQERIDAYNDILKRYAARNSERVAVFDLASFVCPHQDSCDDRTSLGGRFRPSDGIHFEGEGAAEVAQWLIGQLDRMER